MTQCLLPRDRAGDAVPIRLIEPDHHHELASLTEPQQAFVAASGFKARAGQLAFLPDSKGQLDVVLFGLGGRDDVDRTPFLPGKLAGELPSGIYRLEGRVDDRALATLAFALGRYRFARYRSSTINTSHRDCRLVVPAGVDLAEIERVAVGVGLTRDLINTPANDMGPDELEAAVRQLGERHGARVESTAGDDLLAAGLPMIHAVGRASDRAPRLIELRWGADEAPAVTLIGKGVCFDTGGLDIKPASAMTLMKKDMAGAASVLGLAAMIMSAELPLRLRVLIPAVENAISASAFRPGDVLRSRAGITVSIGNTDAEGRLVLADALTLAGEEDCELIVDMATLTGAARAALGPEVPPFYTHDDQLAADLAEAAVQVYDPLWRMPLWRPYEKLLESKIADIDNSGTGGMAGSVTAALFLSRFMRCPARWVHFDIYGWNASSKPGRPEGGEAQGVRALYEMLRRRYAK